MLGEPENQFSLTRAALSTGGRAKRNSLSLTGQATELVCFRLDEPLALARVRELGGNPDQVKILPLGSFLAWNRLSGGRLDGELF